ncbi:MAG: hypothetical protein NTZ74_08605 [Chloroflexi bacterium]|nr:hypothetical protein [Chloroflexota bacterium]
MKTMNIRTMRDIPYVQTLKYRSVPAHREHIMAEITRLEHEKARLDREIVIWVSNQQKAQNRKNMVQTRIDSFQRMIEGLLPNSLPVKSKKEEENKSGNYREVTLEY